MDENGQDKQRACVWNGTRGEPLSRLLQHLEAANVILEQQSDGPVVRVFASAACLERGYVCLQFDHADRHKRHLTLIGIDSGGHRKRRIMQEPQSGTELVVRTIKVVLGQVERQGEGAKNTEAESRAGKEEASECFSERRL